MVWKKVISIGVILCSLLLSSNAFADTPWTKYSYFTNYGGLNDQLSSTEINDNEASDIQNIIYDTGGALRKRYGYTAVPNDLVQKASTGSTVCLTGLSFYKKDNNNRFVVAITNNDSKATAMYKAYQVGGGLENGAWHNIDFSALPSTYSNDYLADFAVARDQLVITVPSIAGVKPFVWTGSGNVSYLTYDSDCPTASLVRYHKNQLFLSGNLTYPSRVWFSALDDITNYDATSFFDCDTSDGTRVRGMVSVFNALYIFKDKSIWCLTGTNKDDFVLAKLVDGIGTLSEQSIAIVNNSIVFTTAQNDIAIYDGGYNVVFISQKIRNTIGGLNFTRATNTLGLAFSTYKYSDVDYYASVSNAGSGTNNNILFFDTALKAWSKFQGIDANAWCAGEDSTGQNILIFGDYNGYVHTYPSTQYYDANVATSPTIGFYEATSPISAFYQTKWFKYSDISLGDKYWRLLKTFTLSENPNTFLTTEVKSDYEASGRVMSLNIGQSGSLWNVSKWDVDSWGGQGLITNRNEVNKGKNMFQIKYSNSNVDEGFTIFGWEVFIEKTDRI